MCRSLVPFWDLKTALREAVRDIPQYLEKPLLATSGVDVKLGCLSAKIIIDGRIQQTKPPVGYLAKVRRQP